MTSLAEEFGVSEMTVRRDLDALAAQGRVVRTHGGAAPASGMVFQFRFLERAEEHRAAFCTATAPGGNPFPMTIKAQRIAPGHKNTWYLEILGTKGSARWSSKQINTLEVMEYSGGEQAWQVIDMGHEMAHKSITGGIFEAGFSDSILQMWAAFLYELEHGRPISRFAGCVTPEEAAWSHRLFTAALRSQDNGTTESV